MEIPGLYQIDLSLAARYDDFSDVGDTTNPKYGINWNITKGFRVRGNYAESFVAPPIAVIGDPSQGYLYASGSVGGTGTLNVPVALYPDVVNVPGAVVAEHQHALHLGLRCPAPSDRTAPRCAASSVAGSRGWDRSSVRATRSASTSRRTPGRASEAQRLLPQ